MNPVVSILYRVTSGAAAEVVATPNIFSSWFIFTSDIVLSFNVYMGISSKVFVSVLESSTMISLMNTSITLLDS